MKVFNDLKTRGCNDILIAVTDGLKGMAEALGVVYPDRGCELASRLVACDSVLCVSVQGAARRVHRQCP
jgi:hypothetical protein